ncbi:hypothetical protein TIFTF001_000943 [Ficus carica]|uniref:Uncharacterized protein n=1 Tax=Ficus carica TaxID=3494 RepID=A0AA88CL23_FICCA|nr:hypothetical protein TIFTF001_000943 [Ficus carica]
MYLNKGRVSETGSKEITMRQRETWTSEKELENDTVAGGGGEQEEEEEEEAPAEEVAEVLSPLDFSTPRN